MPARRMAVRRSARINDRTATMRFGVVALLALGLALAWPTATAAQDPDQELVGQLVQVRLSDGTQLVGTVESLTETEVVLTTPAGARFEVDRSQVVSMIRAQGSMEGGQFFQEDPNATRLFFSATGRTLRQGEGYLGTYLIILPFVGVGITDRFTLAAGAPLTLGEIQPFYLAPKLQLISTDRAAVSIGTLHFTLDADFVDDAVGVAYAVGTFGSRDNAVTLGLGFGYTGSDFSGNPVAMVGLERRLSPRTKFISENYFLPGETGAVLSAGVRFIGDRLSADLGIAGGGDENGSGCCVPLVNFSYSFGAGR